MEMSRPGFARPDQSLRAPENGQHGLRRDPRRRRVRCLGPSRSARARGRPRTRASSTSPGSTTRLKRQSSMPAKNGMLAAVRPRREHRDGARTGAIASIVSTPGMTGRSGKWPAQPPSSAEPSRRPTTRLPGSSSSISSTSRNGARWGISCSITSRPNGAAGPSRATRSSSCSRRRFRPRCAWHFAFRPACRPPARSPRTSTRARPSARPLAPARRDAGKRGAQLTAELRHAGGTYRVAGGPGADVVVERLVHRAARRSAASRHVFTTRRCSHVENCASPRNCCSRTQTFASASCAASRASSGSRSMCLARRSTRGAWRAQSASRAARSPSFARFTRIGSLSFS